MRRPLLAVVLAAVALVTACTSSPTGPAPTKLTPSGAVHDGNAPVDTLKGFVVTGG